ncbi:MaoC family dehydratase [Anaerosalibacter massiliensis]|uniref:MaoC family dehydratase n=1 Tax=Anaerosalibacter massiliensis TaxID=1347392 RepID=A0A9X2MIQ7_9FIRM|nr:MaoC family dehydratase [Anaerosalibacter massiliensis]MCR2044454.1 MaoC family dehydratase [Anaerosalibacter massiliensis]
MAHMTLLNERSYDEVKIGDTAEITKTITETDVVNYAGIIADFNPLHVNKEYAERSMFGQRVVHGMLVASFFSTIVGVCIPGVNALYLSQEAKFIKPTFIGDTITAKAEVIEKIDEKKRIILKTEIYNQKDELVVTGKAITMLMED